MSKSLIFAIAIGYGGIAGYALAGVTVPSTFMLPMSLFSVFLTLGQVFFNFKKMNPGEDIKLKKLVVKAGEIIISFSIAIPMLITLIVVNYYPDLITPISNAATFATLSLVFITIGVFED